jgi:hypothetical protein
MLPSGSPSVRLIHTKDKFDRNVLALHASLTSLEAPALVIVRVSSRNKNEKHIPRGYKH